jgi:50S ribosomal protein L16 3-hydroxylase
MHARPATNRARSGALEAPLQRLGDLRVREFLARYWQRRPALIRQALLGAGAPFTRERLIELAADGEVESRLVTAFGGRWQLAHGPFSRADLPMRRRSGWTLLVQGVDLYDAAAARLASGFRFIPSARFDDVMASYAVDGGGVGPHIDFYDVFLLQAHGRRRWRIARGADPKWIPGLPLRILADFRPQQEWTLEPGDLLYLPPGIAHEGVALGECVTVSIGFRAPTWQEFAETWSVHQAEANPLPGRYGDPGLRPTRHPGRLPPGMEAAALDHLARRGPRRADVRRALLDTLTEPKPNIVFERPRALLTLERFAGRARRYGVAADLRTRMLYAGGAFAINGEVEAVAAAARSDLHRLADDRKLSAARVAGAHPAVLAQLHQWYRFGWLHLGEAPAR